MESSSYYNLEDPECAGFRFMVADWWTELSQDEYIKEAKERHRCLNYSMKHGGGLPANSKYRALTQSAFFVTGVVPILEHMIGEESEYADISSHSIILSNKKRLHIFGTYVFRTKFCGPFDVMNFFLILLNYLYEGTKHKYIELMPSRTASIDSTLSTIARKSQVAVEWWWNMQDRAVYMPDGRKVFSQSAKDQNYCNPTFESIVIGHYEEMMLKFQLQGVTKDTDPSTL